MEIDTSNISGLYLVADPSMERKPLLNKIERALEGGVDLLQIWNHWSPDAEKADKEQFICSITEIAEPYSVPVLINDDWQLLKKTSLHGVHFDKIPENFDHIKSIIGREFIAGITCMNDLQVTERAEELGMDYISFCAMFPSPSAGECEIVQPETVKEARKRTSLPIFLSGGVTPETLSTLSVLDFDGVAVISGILSSDTPRQNASNYKQTLNNLTTSK